MGVDQDTTQILLERAKEGDEDARGALIRRYLPALKRWARGRLPPAARNAADTDDLVQVTLIRALDGVERFEYRQPGAFLAYLRRILQNQIRDHARRAGSRPPEDSLPETLTLAAASPLEQAIGKETLEMYEGALERLTAPQQEAVMMRIELGFTWSEIAAAIGSPSPNAARMLVTRALTRLVEEMDARR
jgi:RNA polymerase sigma-70 factor (ECF subfamily)